MDIPVKHDKIAPFKVVVRTAGLFNGVKLLVDGKEHKANKGVSELGNGTRITLKARLADPVPRLFIDDEEVFLAPPLNGFAYVWAAWPIALVFVGGGIGAFLGFVAAYVNCRVYRSSKNTFLKYVLTFLVSITSLLIYFILAGLVEMLMRK